MPQQLQFWNYTYGNYYKCEKGFVHKDVHPIVVYSSKKKKKKAMGKIFQANISGRKIIV